LIITKLEIGRCPAGKAQTAEHRAIASGKRETCGKAFALKHDAGLNAASLRPESDAARALAVAAVPIPQREHRRLHVAKDRANSLVKECLMNVDLSGSRRHTVRFRRTDRLAWSLRSDIAA